MSYTVTTINVIHLILENLPNVTCCQTEFPKILNKHKKWSKIYKYFDNLGA